jgi:EpsI family protein
MGNRNIQEKSILSIETIGRFTMSQDKKCMDNLSKPFPDTAKPPSKLQTAFTLLVLSIPTGLVYFDAFEWLVSIWWNNKEYSHGFIVPLISIYIAWTKREMIAILKPHPAYFAGGLILLTSACLLVVGRMGGIILAEAVSFLFFLPGVVLILWGFDHLRALAFPLAYLQFMVPWMEEFIHRIHWFFQHISADVGTWILQKVGIPVFQVGKYIHLSNITLEVAKECSGVVFLTTVFALGLPLVYITQKTWTRATFVIISGVFLTVITNGLRVALVGLIANKYGNKMIHGPFHIFQGVFVAQVGFLGLFLINWGVLKIPCSKNTRLNMQWKPRLVGDKGGSRDSPLFRRAAVLCLFLVSFGLFVKYSGVPYPVPTRNPMSTFPYVIGEWKGAENQWLQASKFFPGLDASLTRVYSNAEGRSIHLFLGYFETQRQGKSLISQYSRPLSDGAREISAPWSNPLGSTRAHLSFPNIEGRRYHLLYWYRFPSGSTTGRLETKWKAVSDSLLYRQNSGGIVILAIPAEENMEGASAENILMPFTKDVALLVADYY